MEQRIRVALVGVGNCASSLVQGVSYYEQAADDARIPGLMHVNLGGYHIRDIEFVAAFDVNTAKVGRDLSEAIYAAPNNTYRFCDVSRLGVTVMAGPVLDGVGRYTREVVPLTETAPVDVVRVLKDTGADVLVNYLPVGSEEAAQWYIEQALAAGVGVVNCIPVFIAGRPEWRRRFEAASLPLIGDDIKSQVGA
ncbi:MAG: inositol-3-phosphate synthase, partial [Chloroflexi bacterium]|nr:inositol-3-phosphate synthase [Chloroflexota bacterium]